MNQKETETEREREVEETHFAVIQVHLGSTPSSVSPGKAPRYVCSKTSGSESEL